MTREVRSSLAKLFIAAAIVGCSTGCSRGPPASQSANPISASASMQPSVPTDLGCRFNDITAAAGIGFVHETGGRGAKLLPETLGAGAAFFDLDGDARLDIFFVNGDYWPGEAPAQKTRPTSQVYRGKGDGRFEDITHSSQGGISLQGMACAPGDFDGDGDADILVTGLGQLVLLANDRSVLRDVTVASRLTPGSWRDAAGKEHAAWSTAAAWFDVENDGDLDLLTTGYVQWSPEAEIFTTIDGTTKAFTTPDRYRGLPPHLHRARGDNTFEDATVAAGLDQLEGKSLGIALWDFDADGLLDAVVANDTRPNFFLRNMGNGRFEDHGMATGIAYDETGRARAGMGIDIQALANDNVPRVAIGNFAEEPMSLYCFRASEGVFTSEASRAGIAQATYATLAFGVEMLDLDLDGALDLIVVNGHIEPDVARLFPGQTHAQSAQAFKGVGDGTLLEATPTLGADFTRPRVGRGLASGDVDGDGDLDLLITTNGGAPALLRNDRLATAHYLRVRLIGRGKNTAAIGAVVKLTERGRTQTRQVRSGSSYLSQSESTLTFGLGQSTQVDTLEVRWPTGRVQNIAVEGIDRTLVVREE